MSYRVKVDDLAQGDAVIEVGLRTMTSVAGDRVWIEIDEIVTDSPEAIRAIIEGAEIVRRDKR